MSESLEDSIEANAQKPASASTDAGSVSQHSLSEQIAADKYLSAKRAAEKQHRGLRITKLVPPGSV